MRKSWHLYVFCVWIQGEKYLVLKKRYRTAEQQGSSPSVSPDLSLNTSHSLSSLYTPGNTGLTQSLSQDSLSSSTSTMSLRQPPPYRPPPPPVTPPLVSDPPPVPPRRKSSEKIKLENKENSPDISNRPQTIGAETTSQVRKLNQ